MTFKEDPWMLLVLPTPRKNHFRASWRRLGAPKKTTKNTMKTIIVNFAFRLGFKAKVGSVTTFSDQCDLRISWVPVHFIEGREIVRRGGDHFGDHPLPSKRFPCW